MVAGSGTRIPACIELSKADRRQMEGLAEFTAVNPGQQLGPGYPMNRNTGFGLPTGNRSTSLNGVNPEDVGMAGSVGLQVAEMDGVADCFVADFLHKFAHRSMSRVFSRLKHPCREFPGFTANGWSILANQRDPTRRVTGEDRQIIGLCESVVDLTIPEMPPGYRPCQNRHPGRQASAFFGNDPDARVRTSTVIERHLSAPGFLRSPSYKSAGIDVVFHR